MAYDEQLAERIRTTLADQEAVEERKMFGGIAWPNPHRWRRCTQIVGL